MKILIFSDSHRNVEPMITAAAKEEPNVIIHLGDVESDAVALRRCIPGIMICSVPGNCDFMPLGPHRLLIKLEGKTIFAAHGHTYGVKSSYASIINAAMAARADILLFGHTHQALEMERDGLLIINPGSIGMQGRTYGVLTIQNGNVEYEKEYIQNGRNP